MVSNDQYYTHEGTAACPLGSDYPPPFSGPQRDPAKPASAYQFFFALPQADPSNKLYHPLQSSAEKWRTRIAWPQAHAGTPAYFARADAYLLDTKKIPGRPRCPPPTHTEDGPQSQGGPSQTPGGVGNGGALSRADR